MEETEILKLWKAQDAKIEQMLTLNQRLLREVMDQKAKSALNGLRRLKTGGIIAFVLYLIFLGNVLYYSISNYSPDWNYFIVSVAAITVINIKALADYIKHLVWVNNINYDNSVTEIQQQLSRLQLSIIGHAKVMCLQFPFFTTFFLSSRWFPQEVSWGYIAFQIAMTTLFSIAAYWLYKNHKVENLDKKWLQNLLSASGGKSVAKAIEFYKELEEFKLSN